MEWGGDVFFLSGKKCDNDTHKSWDEVFDEESSQRKDKSNIIGDSVASQHDNEGSFANAKSSHRDWDDI